MTDDYLLVPMRLDAMVLNQTADATTPFLRFQMHYDRLSQFRSPEPAPFDGTSAIQPAAGIYLHWTLPKALRHGMHKDDGSTEFPLVPNRWLVVRIQAGAPANAIKAWVLESDYLDATDGTSPFIDPRTAGPDGLPQPTQIGRARLLQDFVESSTQGAPFLTALAPANPLFAVFSPGAENVFSFIDDVTDDAGVQITKGEFTYHVTGWYSDPGYDPLNDPNLEWVANGAQYQLQWSEATPETTTQHDFDWFVLAGDAELPKKVLTHAMLASVCWDRTSGNVPAGNYPADIKNNVRVAFGNTATDALSGIVRLDQNNQTEADLWEAFQYDLLDVFNEPGSAEALNMGIREHWYGASPGGTRWTVVAKEQTDSAPAPAPVISAQQAKAQANALADLNAKQAELDRQQRILESMQWNLFSLWWKQNWLAVNQDAASYFDSQISGPIQSWLNNQLALHTGKPVVVNPWIFGPNDLLDAAGFCATLQAGADPLSVYVLGLFDGNTQDLIDDYTPGSPPTPDLLSSLIFELNALLKYSSFYEAASFAQVSLSPETQQLIAANPQSGIELAHLNRLLFEDGYPAAIRRISSGPAGGTDPTQESWYIRRVQAQQNLVEQLKSQTFGPQGAHATLQGQLLSTQELKTVSAPQYYAANDPVILITGLGRATNFDPIDGLTCRLPSQTVNSLTVGGTTYGFDSSAQQNIVNQVPALTNTDKVPDAIRQLHLESFLLSPRLFAQNVLGDTVPCPVPAGTPDPQADAVRQAYSALPQPAAANRFAPVSFETTVKSDSTNSSDGSSPKTTFSSEWQQPWVPLVLDWEVKVLRDPAYTAPTDPNSANLQLECQFDQSNWQFDGTDYTWIGPTAPGTAGYFSTSSQMVLSGRTFITPQLSFRLADQLEDYVNKHKFRDPDLQKLVKKLESYLPVFKNQDILSQRLSGLRAMLVERSFSGHVAPFGDIANVVGGYGHGHPAPFTSVHEPQLPAVWDFAPMAGTFFVLNRLSVIDSFGRKINLMLANYSSNPQDASNQNFSDASYFYPIAGRNLRSQTSAGPLAKDPAPGIGPAGDATQQMLQLAPRLSQDSQLSFQLLSNDGQDQNIYQLADANPICGWIVPNHLDRSLALYGPDGAAWGELYVSLQAQNNSVPVWQPDPTNASAPQTVDDIPNSFAREMMKALWDRTTSDGGQGFSDFLQVIDETLWTINPRGQRQDQSLSVMIGRPLAIVRAQMSLKLKGLPYYNQDWWNTFQVDFLNLKDDGTVPYDPGAFDGGVCRPNLVWPVRLGSQVLRDDGFIGYFVDDPNTPDNTFKAFNTVNLPAEVQPGYLKQIGQKNYLQLCFIDDTVVLPDPAQNQVCKLTMLVDPRGSIHAFSGLLPVVTLDIPSEFVGAALEKMSYTFRAGPFLTSPDEVRIPQPAEKKGTWSWFDFVANATVELAKADDQVRLSTTTPLIKEGWLKFTPDSSADGN